MAKKKSTPAKNLSNDFGDYVVLNGQKLAIRKHPTDFSVMASADQLNKEPFENITSLSPRMARAGASRAGERDRLMDEVREDNVAHHIYQVEETGEEIVIDDRVILKLRREGTGELEAIMKEYHLVYDGRMGDSYVLRLTDATNRNPVKLANELTERDEVESCSPHVMLDMQRFQTPALLSEQWYLNAGALQHPDISLSADIDAPEAWEITTGSPEIVVAVIDDGFDLGHPAFTGVRIHPDKRDFVDNDNNPLPDSDDYHGTPVASIAVGAHHDGSPMRGIAPNCTFLPVRIGFGAGSPQVDILEVFRYVSQRADVVNCSFGISPSSFDRMHPDFRRELTRLCESGGRRGKGLVMVFSAANDDSPTFLNASENINGVLYTRASSTGSTEIAEIPAGSSVFSGYPMTQGVVAVGAMSSLRRKSGYSCWGPHLTVTAPSNNMHYITSFVRAGSDARRDRFVATYRGLGQVAAVNRAGVGAPFSPIRRTDDPSTPLREDQYTRGFGGTSGAAPVVTGVVGLILSANPDLSAQEVRQILMATADTDLDFTLDLGNDPNLQGLGGEFISGHSRYFGAGKINAFHAVRRARALRQVEPVPEPQPEPTPAPARLSIGTRANLPIPDNQPAGVVSQIDICRSGRLRSISVEIDITHTYRGDLKVVLVAPSGVTATLQQVTNQSGSDLKRTYTSADTPDLASLIASGMDVRGRWTLHVSDNLRRDEGTLNTWFLEMQVG